jgi:hypothetical protein
MGMRLTTVKGGQDVFHQDSAMQTEYFPLHPDEATYSTGPRNLFPCGQMTILLVK